MISLYAMKALVAGICSALRLGQFGTVSTSNLLDFNFKNQNALAVQAATFQIVISQIIQKGPNMARARASASAVVCAAVKKVPINTVTPARLLRSLSLGMVGKEALADSAMEQAKSKEEVRLITTFPAAEDIVCDCELNLLMIDG